MVEHVIRNDGVVGSIPISGTSSIQGRPALGPQEAVGDFFKVKLKPENVAAWLMPPGAATSNYKLCWTAGGAPYYDHQVLTA